MKIKYLLLVLLAVVTVFLSSCGTRGIRKDTDKIADMMCRNLEIMNKLRTINPNDTMGARILRSEGEALQEEMTKFYQSFREKYGDKSKDPEFNKTYSHELRKAMLKCPYLSKEEKEQFQKDIKN